MLSEKAKKIHRMKYAKGDEDWTQTCLRVADYISLVEDTEENKAKYLKEFFNIIFNLFFIPGGRVLANAGTGIKNLMNCFVLPVDDSRQGIYETLKKAAEVFAWGGGIGFNFSNLREEDADVITTGGKASGPLSFMSLFDQTGEVISQASRRGAQIGLLDIDHPDIEKFINFKSTPNNRNKRLLEEYKRNLKLNKLNSDGRKYFKVLEKTLQDDQLSHFNISVSITDEFMNAVEKDLDWNLISKQNGSVVKTIKAKDLFKRMAEMAWESGDPGILFYDRANEDNMVPYLGDIKATNPCGEIPLMPYESCCLGSLNLHKFFDPEDKKVDLQALAYVTKLAVRFLDNVQTISETPVDEINSTSKSLRRLGLGIMGWADLLAELEIPYDSDEAIKLARFLSWFISMQGWATSIELAMEKGTFDLYKEDEVNLNLIDKIISSEYVEESHFDLDSIRENGVRNVAVTSIAPTGTIALIANVNSGIEPFFGLAYKRNITEGIGNTAKDFFVEINPILFRKLEELGFDEKELEGIKKALLEKGTLEGIENIPEKLKAVFKTSHEISPEKHVDMQSAWQEFIDNSISKTINLPQESTVEDIENIYMYMWKKKLKGGTIYRDKSKTFQILNLGK